MAVAETVGTMINTMISTRYLRIAVTIPRGNIHVGAEASLSREAA
jgi:hypothetical protein